MQIDRIKIAQYPKKRRKVGEKPCEFFFQKQEKSVREGKNP
jgi:hypothetical protein